jgi:Na+(H+)/acetate symporter ActP
MSHPAFTVFIPSYRLLAVLFALGATLHNLEEARSLTDWARAHLKLGFAPDARIYWAATSAVSVAIWLAAIGVIVRPDNQQFVYAISGFAFAMAVNAVVPHVALSLATRSYSPGTATGMLLNLPLGGLLLCALFSSGALTWAGFWGGSLLYALALGAGAIGSVQLAHSALASARRRAG